jgi:hypothetical protein
MRSLALFVGSPEHWEHWGNLLHSVKTGEPAVKHVRKQSAYEYLSTHSELGALYNAAMTSVDHTEIMPILMAYDFSGFKKIVDVGGGHGSLMTAILSKHPEPKGVIFDQASVIAGTQKALKAAGLQDRCETQAGSFFDSVPKGGDAYIIKHILHDWDEKRLIKLLKNVKKAMKPTGKLLVCESVLPEGNVPHPGKRLDLEMLVFVGGKERTEREYRELFAKGGFKLTRVVQTLSPTAVLEAKPMK